MCGRFYLDTNPQNIESEFDVNFVGQTFLPRYNIAPSQPVLTITEGNNERSVQTMRWGLIPSWAKSIDSRYSMINARAESIHEKPAYKGPFMRTRCLIPASGFYEWKKEKDNKQPYCITRNDGELMVFAGIWDSWSGVEEIIHSCSIITTDAVQSIRHVHERMPVMLVKDKFSAWLNPENQDTNQLREMLIPCCDSDLESWPVSKSVNSPANDNANLIEHI